MPFVVFALFVGGIALVIKAHSRAHGLEPKPLTWTTAAAQMLPAFKNSGAKFAVYQFINGTINNLYLGDDKNIYNRVWESTLHLPGVFYKWDLDKNGGNYPDTIDNRTRSLT